MMNTQTKMQKRIRFYSILLCIVMICGIVGLSRIKLEASSGSKLYYNDKNWILGIRKPMVVISGEYYLPSSLFSQLPNVEVQNYQAFRSLLIENTAGGEYDWISFDIDNGYATIVDRDEPPKRLDFHMRTYSYNDDIYVPAVVVCGYIGLKLETLTSPVNGDVVLRISDGSETIPFEELVLVRYPKFYTVETSTESSEPITSDTTETVPSVSDTTETIPPVSDTTIPKPVLPERTIYLTFDGIGEYTAEILSVLAEYQFPATFFVTEEQAVSYPEILSSIAAHGHEIAILTTENVTESLYDVNDILVSFLKKRSHIWRYESISEQTSDITVSGYLYFGYNINAVSVKSVISDIWKIEVPMIRFTESSDILRGVLDFIAEHADVCTLYAV